MPTQLLTITIPNYDGCFFIEKDDTLDIGTEITLYIDNKISRNIQPDKIIDYICDTMQDISCNIFIKDEINKKEMLLRSKELRKYISSKEVLFIPFLDSGEIVENISLERTIRTNDYIEKYPYGLLVNITRNNQAGAILNSGIKLYDTDVGDIWGMLFNVDTRTVQYLNNFFVFNFPSNYLNIDVSREKITSLDKTVIASDFKIKLLNEILKQITEYINLSKVNETTNAAINLHLLIMVLVQLCKQDSELSRLNSVLMSMRYGLFIRFNKNSLDLIVSRQNNKPVNAFSYIQNNYSKFDDEFEKFVSNNLIKDNQTKLYLQEEYIHKILPEIRELFDRRAKHSLFLRDDFDQYFTYKYPHYDNSYFPILEYLQKKLKCKDYKMVYAFLVLEAFLLKKNDASPHIAIMENILGILLEQYTISAIENGECVVSIRQEDIAKVIKRLN